MPKLQAKGHNEYVSATRVPSEMATSESKIVFSAFRSAIESLLEMVTADTKSAAADEAVMLQFVALRKLYKEMRDDMQHVDLVMEILEKKVMSFGWES